MKEDTCLDTRCDIVPSRSPQRGSVRVDSVDDFAYGAQILVNTVDKVTLAVNRAEMNCSGRTWMNL